jgi:LmbE family N-acetylglucosaminyl deacetylase
MDNEYQFKPVQRYVVPAPIPHIVTEKKLPRNHKILVVLPHGDDGRYFGSTLSLLNKTNDVKIVIMSPGYHGVETNISKNKKIKQRWDEAVAWAKMLGFKIEQLVDFRADKTYKKETIDNTDMQKLHWFMEYEKPTLIFLPHISDTAHAINYNSRVMTIRALSCWMTDRHKRNSRDKKPILIAEYPTNHVPILPPSDKNFIVTFTDPSIAEIKHQANKCHVSQKDTGFEMTERMVEAIETVTEAEDIYQAHKRRKRARLLSDVCLDSNTSRGEQFGITKFSIKMMRSVPFIVEERLKFPLSKSDKNKWNNA